MTNVPCRVVEGYIPVVAVMGSLESVEELNDTVEALKRAEVCDRFKLTRILVLYNCLIQVPPQEEFGSLFGVYRL